MSKDDSWTRARLTRSHEPTTLNYADKRLRIVLAVAFLGILVPGLSWMLLRAPLPPDDPPGTVRTYRLRDMICIAPYRGIRISNEAYVFDGFKDNLLVVTRTADGFPHFEDHVWLEKGRRFTIWGIVYEIQSWDRDKGTVTLTFVY